LIAGIKIVRHVAKRADPVAALIHDIIEALFELALAALFGFPRDCLRGGLR
jgi:hypothetical protein